MGKTIKYHESRRPTHDWLTGRRTGTKVTRTFY